MDGNECRCFIGNGRSHRTCVAAALGWGPVDQSFSLQSAKPLNFAALAMLDIQFCGCSCRVSQILNLGSGTLQYPEQVLPVTKFGHHFRSVRGIWCSVIDPARNAVILRVAWGNISTGDGKAVREYASRGLSAVWDVRD